MKEAHRLYYLAQARQAELKDLALDFYRECVKDFEEEAKEGSFVFILYNDNIPDDIQEDFEELVIPLFKEENFRIERYYSPFFTSCDGWKISWALKGENIQYE